MPVFAKQGFERRLHLFAIGAAVIEKLDQRHIALRIAGDRRFRIVEDLATPRRQCLRRLIARIALYLVLGGLQRVDQHVGVFRQVIVDDRLDRLALVRGEFRRIDRTR